MIHEEFLRQYLPTQRQKLAIDVGANEGIWVKQFAPLFDKVLAVEPDPKCAEIVRNLKLENVEVFEAAGWIVSGQNMDFHLRDNYPMSGALVCRDLMREDAVSALVSMPTLAIDSLPKEHCDLIWIDVEGAELQVIQGATRTIEAFKPQIVVECHEVENRYWIQAWLNRAGYNTAIIHNPTREHGHRDWDRNTHLIATHWRYRGTW